MLTETWLNIKLTDIINTPLIIQSHPNSYQGVVILATYPFTKLQPILKSLWTEYTVAAIAHSQTTDNKPQEVITVCHYSRPGYRAILDQQLKDLVALARINYPDRSIILSGDLNRNAKEA